MSYVRANKIAKRFKQDRRVSGADILRQELDLDENLDVSLLNENSESGRRGGNHLMLDNSIVGANQSLENITSTVVASATGGGIISDTSAVTKISRLQMSSTDFEEWIKLATDNKINSTNSWNFALIDYFHEMSLLKEGDNINFQKASATLDGCVKIYSSRVDSIATETGRLLTGLATKKNKNGEAGENGELNQGVDGEGNEVDNSGDEGNGDSSKKKKKLNRARMVDTTLVDFETIKMKKLDQELEIDPLFKRALSEFDEGGAKSLLLNILNINTELRMVFDAAGKANENQVSEKLESISEENEEDKEVLEQNDEIEEDDDEENDDDFHSVSESPAPAEVELNQVPTIQNDIDAVDLKRFIYLQPDDLETFEICPAMKSLNIVLKDINQAKTILSDVNANRNNNFPVGHGSQSLDFDENDENGNDYNNDNGDFMTFDVDFQDDDLGDNSYGSENHEIANVFADDGNDDDGDDNDNDNDRNGGNDGNQNDGLIDFDNDDQGEPDAEKNANNGEADDDGLYMEQIENRDLMAYFDKNVRGINWAGPEHWKVRALKKRETKSTAPQDKDQTANGTLANGKPKKNKKEEFKIDFLSEEDMDDAFEEKLFKTGKIDLPKNQQTSENNNLLPKDIYFGSSRLLKLFCKPDNVRSLKRKNSKSFNSSLLKMNSDVNDEENELAINEAADENYWANKYKQEEENKEAIENNAEDEDDGYGDAGFFNGGRFDHGYDDDDFDAGIAGNSGNLDLGTNLDEAKIEDGKPLESENNLNLGIGSNLIAGGRKIRPEYVNFSRTAKRVDVKYLKNNLWKSLTYENAKLEKKKIESDPDRSKENHAGFDENDEDIIDISSQADSESPVKPEEKIKFTNVVNNIAKMYPVEEKKDLSTSFCFICLLHLANEHGLTIENEQGLQDLEIVYNDQPEA